jgi:hypothetical protein
MSWSISLNGSPVGLNAAVEQSNVLPLGVKALAKEMVNRLAPNAEGQGAVVATLVTSGHFDSNGGNATISVGRIALVPEPLPAAVPGPLTNTPATEAATAATVPKPAPTPPESHVAST